MTEFEQIDDIEKQNQDCSKKTNSEMVFHKIKNEKNGINSELLVSFIVCTVIGLIFALITFTAFSFISSSVGSITFNTESEKSKDVIYNKNFVDDFEIAYEVDSEVSFLANEENKGLLEIVDGINVQQFKDGYVLTNFEFKNGSSVPIRLSVDIALYDKKGDLIRTEQHRRDNLKPDTTAAFESGFHSDHVVYSYQIESVTVEAVKTIEQNINSYFKLLEEPYIEYCENKSKVYLKIKNISDYGLSYVNVKLDWYDEDGNFVVSRTERLTYLGQDMVWSIEQELNYPNAQSVVISSVTYHDVFYYSTQIIPLDLIEFVEDFSVLYTSNNISRISGEIKNISNTEIPNFEIYTLFLNEKGEVVTAENLVFDTLEPGESKEYSLNVKSTRKNQITDVKPVFIKFIY